MVLSQVFLSLGGLSKLNADTKKYFFYSWKDDDL